MTKFPRLAARRFAHGFMACVIACATATLAVAGEAPKNDARREFFEAKVRPVLAVHCYNCHGAAKQQGGLRVDSRDGLLKGGESGTSLIPGQPDESLLVRVLDHAEPGVEMPKKAPKLPANVRRDFRDWVAAGAFDPRDTPPTAEESAQQEWQAKLAERRSWWSLQPVVRPPVPEPRAAERTFGPIDKFLLVRLEAAGIEQSPPAERALLARRLAFVLTGLPPTLDDLRAFLKDTAPDAYERFVDRLLASPRFGEQWARHWMDVVRFGDTYGYEWDIPAKGAWRYRDYLVRAFNDDVAYDQLIREQLAGDLLDSPRIDLKANRNDSFIGLLFYQLGENRHGDSAEFDGIHQEMIHNKIDAFSKAFQAITIGCARCHDHKLDAVSQRDYYALAGAFQSARSVTNTVDTPGRDAAAFAELHRLKRELRPVLADWWRASARDWDDGLRVAKPGSAWQKAIAAAGAAPPLEHPLHAWVALVKAEKEVAQAWAKLQAAYANESKQRTEFNAKTFRVVTDFRQALPPGWSLDGVGFRDGPVHAGDFALALEGEPILTALLPGGLFTNALSPRMNGVLRSPFLKDLPEPWLSLQTCGGDFAAERTVVDNAFLTERQSYLARRDPAWSSVPAAAEFAGRRVFREIATKTSNPNFPPRVGLGGACSEAQVADPRSWFGVTRAVVSKGPETPKDELTRSQSLFDGPAPTTLAEAATRYADWWRAALGHWAHEEATDDDVVALNWLLDAGVLPNRTDNNAPASVRELVAAYRAAEKKVSEPSTVNGLRDLDPGDDYRLNLRGEYDKLGPAVPRGYLEVLAGSESAAPFHDRRSGRLELAERVASPNNPLTARVYVNRIWHWVFGAGLVSTPDDFGRLGEKPSHPELLDWLADRFVTDGWSTKRLVRALVTTAAFRQGDMTTPKALEVDPRNRLLHHYPLRRLEAESVRDAILAASGRLDARLYGPPVDPHRSSEDPQKRLFSGPLDGDGRRSLYTKLTIMEPPRFLATFNQPPPKIPSGRRDVTDVPAQALALLNDPFVVAQAKFWGERVAASATDETIDARIALMFAGAFGRSPTTEESERWRTLVADLARERGVKQADVLKTPVVWTDIAHALFNVKEFLYIR
jgi:Protein of unknown function (DUF1553)/Protein of unknown function (DUF1549)/Planctomycete cytochrome C